MKGQAKPGTLTGDVQLALTDEWKTQGQIVYDARIFSVKSSTLTALLERLVREGRAEQRQVTAPYYMGVISQYRKVQT
jgi:hypothetical protein